MPASISYVPPAVAKMRSIFGDAVVDTVREQLTLDPEPKPFELRAEKIAILPFVARSGSTYATQLLSGQSPFGTVTDWFLPRRLKQLQEKGKGGTHNQVVQHILRDRAGIVFASKCTRDSLITAAFLGIFDQFLDHITFLVIDRRDKVAQAVSFHKARVGGRFHSSQAERRTVRPDDFDFDEIYRFYRRFHDISAKFDSLGDAFGRPLQRFWYEDFTADPLAFVKAATRALGFQVAQDLRAEAQVQKLGDAINDEWAQRFRTMLADGVKPEPA